MKFKITYIDNNKIDEKNVIDDDKNVIDDEFKDELSEMDKNVIDYIESLNDNEKKALIIAKQHLETSFCIEKSNGFINWMKNKK
jgi:hypothetical protein